MCFGDDKKQESSREQSGDQSGEQSEKEFEDLVAQLNEGELRQALDDMQAIIRRHPTPGAVRHAA